MENGDFLFARIAELEKENEKLKKENEEYEAVELYQYSSLEKFIMRGSSRLHEADDARRAFYRKGKVIDGKWVNDENSDEDEDDDDEDEEKWIVICSKATFGADKKIDGTIAKNTYTFDNYSDAKQEFDNCVKAEETKERYAEIELALESEDNLEQLEIWFCDDFDELEESDDEESTDEDTDDEEEEEEEVLEDLTCAQLKTRLRAINKPVSGRKAALIQRIREHEELKAALFEED